MMLFINGDFLETFLEQLSTRNLAAAILISTRNSEFYIKNAIQVGPLHCGVLAEVDYKFAASLGNERLSIIIFKKYE